MRKITLKSIAIKNCRSIKDEIFYFPSTFGLRYLGGDNQEEPRLEGNGAGKSSLLHAISWCFYGTGLGKDGGDGGLRTSSLLSWGEALLQVTSVLSVESLGKSIDYTISRTGPPERIYLNNELVTQERIDKLLGLSKLRFCHSVIFGQAYPLFPDISIPKRALLFDEILDLSIWIKCIDAASNKIKKLNISLTEQQKVEANLEGQLQSLESDESIQSKIIIWEDNREKEIERLEKLEAGWLENLNLKIVNIQYQVDSYENKRRSDGNDLIDQLDELNNEYALTVIDIQELSKSTFVKDITLEDTLKNIQSSLSESRFRIKQLNEMWDFYEKNNNCPTCKQEISISSKELKQNEINVDLNNLTNLVEVGERSVRELEERIKEKRQEELQDAKRAEALKAAINKNKQLDIRIKLLEKQINKLADEPNPYDIQITQLKLSQNPYTQQIYLTKEQKNLYIDELARVQNERISIAKQLEVSKEKGKEIEGEINVCNFWQINFKKVRLWFIQRILTSLQIEISSAISALGLVGWKVELATETETKAETIKFGVQIKVKSPKAEALWEVWSGGEAQRLRLAIAQGLANLIQRASGVYWPIEFWDEPSSWLSRMGITDLLESLAYKVAKKSVWVVDHRALDSSAFDDIYLAIKYPEIGTKIQKVG